jgi:hypothetical protein
MKRKSFSDPEKSNPERRKGLKFNQSLVLILLVSLMVGLYLGFYTPATNEELVAVYVVNDQAIRDGNKTLIYGEVVNLGPKPLDEVSVTATLQSRDGGIIGVEKNYTSWRVLAPGDRAPFLITVEKPVEAYRLSVEYREFTTGVAPYRGFKIGPLVVVADPYYISIRFNVTNVGGWGANPVYTIVTFYDEKGRVIWFTRVELGWLDAGAQRAVEVLVPRAMLERRGFTVLDRVSVVVFY